MQAGARSIYCAHSFPSLVQAKANSSKPISIRKFLCAPS